MPAAIRGIRASPRPVEANRNAIQSDQAPGWSTNEIATITPVTVTEIARLRHSRRTMNHSHEIPGVILVRIGRARAAGRLSPTTRAAAIRKWTLPTNSS